VYNFLAFLMQKISYLGAARWLKRIDLEFPPYPRTFTQISATSFRQESRTPILGFSVLVLFFPIWCCWSSIFGAILSSREQVRLLLLIFRKNCVLLLFMERIQCCDSGLQFAAQHHLFASFKGICSLVRSSFRKN